MNIVLALEQFNIDNLQLMEIKKNKLMNGIFTKITYSNENIKLNGIYVKFNINNLFLDKKEDYQCYFPTRDYTQESKNIRYDVKFSILDSLNSYNVNEIIRIETELLNKYKSHKKQYENTHTLSVFNKKIYSIKYNLLNGQYKMYTDKTHFLENQNGSTLSDMTSSDMTSSDMTSSDMTSSDMTSSGIDNHVNLNRIENMSFMFKISGIWEDDSNIGITYKIIHCI